MEVIVHLWNSFRARLEPEQERAEREIRQTEVIEKLARAVVARRLQAPAALFLELNRPLGFLVSQAAYFARPFLALFVPHGEVKAAAEVLDDPQELDRLIARIGELSAKEADR